VTQWGKLGTKPGDFNSPYSIAINADGKVYVADANNNRIEIFTTDGGLVGQFGVNGAAPGQLDKPKSVALDAKGNLYVGDTGNKRIQIFDGAGNYLAGWGSVGKMPGQFDVPHDIAVDQWGNIYVTDADGPNHNNRVQMFASDGSILTMWGSLGADPGQFNFASRIALDRSGLNIYVCDASNNRVQLFGYSR
jgi:DNA-binding beta-propeller fold protein YncE